MTGVAVALTALACSIAAALALGFCLFVWGFFGTVADADHEDDDMRNTGIGA